MRDKLKILSLKNVVVRNQKPKPPLNANTLEEQTHEAQVMAPGRHPGACSAGHTGPPPCVKGDTSHHRPRQTGEQKSARPLHDSTNPGACVRHLRSTLRGRPRKAGNLRARSTHAKAHLLTGGGRERRGRKGTLKFPTRWDIVFRVKYI